MTHLFQALLAERYVDSAYFHKNCVRVCFSSVPLALIDFRPVSSDLSGSCDLWEDLRQLLSKCLDAIIVDLEEQESLSLLRKTT